MHNVDHTNLFPTDLSPLEKEFFWNYFFVTTPLMNSFQYVFKYFKVNFFLHLIKYYLH